MSYLSHLVAFGKLYELKALGGTSKPEPEQQCDDWRL